jgi:mannose-6-phosphate isomerase-like protein (cupin superfamily)
MSSNPNSDLYVNWPAERREEIVENWHNRQVGSRVVSETDQLRIWHLELEPGERAPFHRHDESYFWTVFGSGRSRSYYHDGSVVEADYQSGETRHFNFRNGDFMVHDLENIGDTPLKFVTVEFKS